jgi:hypothetical protein
MCITHQSRSPTAPSETGSEPADEAATSPQDREVALDLGRLGRRNGVLEVVEVAVDAAHKVAGEAASGLHSFLFSSSCRDGPEIQPWAVVFDQLLSVE